MILDYSIYSSFAIKKAGVIAILFTHFGIRQFGIHSSICHCKLTILQKRKKKMWFLWSEPDSSHASPGPSLDIFKLKQEKKLSEPISESGAKRWGSETIGSMYRTT